MTRTSEAVSGKPQNPPHFSAWLWIIESFDSISSKSTQTFPNSFKRWAPSRRIKGGSVLIWNFYFSSFFNLWACAGGEREGESFCSWRLPPASTFSLQDYTNTFSCVCLCVFFSTTRKMNKFPSFLTVHSPNLERSMPPSQPSLPPLPAPLIVSASCLDLLGR